MIRDAIRRALRLYHEEPAPAPDLIPTNRAGRRSMGDHSIVGDWENRKPFLPRYVRRHGDALGALTVTRRVRKRRARIKRIIKGYSLL
jgi:hypothetical protein